jgi:hypothetical protein
MTDDLLARATRALRDEEPAAGDDVRALRARVMVDLRARKRRRVRGLLVALPIAAVLVGTTAWAAGTGRLGRAVQVVKEFVGGGEEESGAGTTPITVPVPVPVPVPVTTSASASASASPSASSSASPSPSPSVSPSATPSVSVSGGVGAPSGGAEEGAADLALYKKAHQLHFGVHDHAGALGAWNEYLAQFPKGTFVVEARYNRAVCLVKLGRNEEARVALKPFADGLVAGGYRQREASALLDALDANP